MTLAMPWFLLLLPLPLLVYWLVPAYSQQSSSLQVPFMQRLTDLTGPDGQKAGPYNVAVNYRM
jgi:Ca-activated chloride channel family protein